ncbi:hypothetical protein V6N12_053400 [Hibiscus sabdariffa]|uniref:Uncharacterized protein n=1 Tax=Hibiscus sabdariffa TaxID=183260 RepID=A0ABR2D7T3_9ROSI
MVATPMQDRDEKDIMGFEAGCINSLKALDPGLVYDLTYDEFRRYLISRPEDKSKLYAMREDVSGRLQTLVLILNVNIRGTKCALDINFLVKPLTLEFNSIGDTQQFSCRTLASVASHPVKMSHTVGTTQIEQDI